MSKVIGNLHWEGCVDCVHYIVDKGDCDIADTTRVTHVESQSIICDSYDKSDKYFSKLDNVQPGSRIKVTYSRISHAGDDTSGNYTGQFRGRIHSTENVSFSVRGEAIWVTTDEGVEEFTNIKDITQIEKLG
ncbi:MAG: hypothetical protein ACOX8V_04470 [Thermoleophilia bacterium]|jgi:hypothetical protein